MGNKKVRGNGEGSYFKVGNRWRYQVTLGKDAEGKLIRISAVADTKAKAKTAVERKIQQREKGLLPNAENSTVHDVIKMQIEDDYASNIIHDNTYRRRLYTLKIIDENGLGNLPVKNVDEFLIKKFFQGLTGYSNSVINKTYDALNKCFKYCCNKKHRIIEYNPLDDFNRPKSNKVDRKVTAFTVDEEMAFIEVMNNKEKNNPYRYQMLLMLYTGMRMGEINALTVNDINFNFQTIRIRRTITRSKDDKPILNDRVKTEAGMRTIRMTKEAFNLLQDYINNHYRKNAEQLLFYDFESKKYITTNQVNAAFKRIVERYGIIPIEKVMMSLSEKNKRPSFKKYTFYEKKGKEYKALAKEPKNWATKWQQYYFYKWIPDRDFSQHMMRHTFATRAIEAGISPKVLQHILGHSDISITLDTYTDVFDKFENAQLDLLNSYMQSLPNKCKTPDAPCAVGVQ